MTGNVLIIQRRMTEYRVPLFYLLRDRLAEQGVTLHVVYGDGTSAEATRNDAGELSWGIKVPCSYLLSRTSKLVWQNIPRPLRALQDLIILPHEIGQLMNYPVLLQRRLGTGPRLAFWGHGGNFQSTSSTSVSGLLRAGTARMVDWWFAYTAVSATKIRDLGFPPGKITCLNNAIDTRALQAWRSVIHSEEQLELLAKLGLRGEHLAIFLGGLYPGKRLEFLLAAGDELHRRVPGFELLIIGDGPQRDFVRRFAEMRSWCRWVGALHGRQKVLYASLGRIMLNPGMVGLNILDSFCLGVPLITTDCGIHSPEIAYLDPGRNGSMTPNDMRSYVDAAQQLLTDGVAREALIENCRSDAQRYSLESMVKNFTAGILTILARPC